MKRRDFIAGASIIAVASPSLATANEIRRIGVLFGTAEDDASWVANWSAFVRAMRQLGWSEDNNLVVDSRTTRGDAALFDPNAVELVQGKPDLLLGVSPLSLAALAHATKTIPIVFTIDIDPVREGILTSISHPGGNITGFTTSGPSFAGKWVELLKELRADLTDVLVMYDAGDTNESGYFQILNQAASSLSIRLTKGPVRNQGEIENSIASFPESGALVVLPSAFVLVQRTAITAAAERHRLPSIYGQQAFVDSGGLMSYTDDQPDEFRRAASYIDRIFRGEKPGDLPVQAPAEFKLTLNLKTAKSLGIAVPQSLLVQADQVIE